MSLKKRPPGAYAPCTRAKRAGPRPPPTAASRATAATLSSSSGGGVCVCAAARALLTPTTTHPASVLSRWMTRARAAPEGDARRRRGAARRGAARRPDATVVPLAFVSCVAMVQQWW